MQYLNGDLARLQVEQDDIKRKQQLAQTLQQAGLNPVQGGNQVLSLLAALTSTLRGNSLMKDASKSMSENLASQFDAQNQADQAKAEAEQRRRDEDYQRELEKLTKAEEAKAKFRAPRNIDPLSPEGMAAQAQLKKMTAGPGPGPSESDRKIEQLRKFGATDDQIRSMLLGGQQRNIDPLSPEGIAAQTKLKGATTAATGADPKSAAAKQALEVLSQLEGNLGASGPVDRFLHPVDAQKFDRTKAQLVNPLQTLTRVPGQGAQSDKELATLMASFPDIGNFDSTNQQQIQNLRSYIEKIQGGQGAPPQGAPPSGAQQEFPDGTVIQNAQGQTMVMQAGQWVPQ